MKDFMRLTPLAMQLLEREKCYPGLSQMSKEINGGTWLKEQIWNIVVEKYGVWLNDSIQGKTSSKIKADQIASQFIENGKTGKTDVKRDEYKIQRDRGNETEDLSIPITSEKLENDIGNMKDHKAVGLDDIFTEEIRHFR